MTWSDPTTRTTGDLITAAIWNQEVVDNGQFLHDRVLPIWVQGQGTSLGDFKTGLAGAGTTERFSATIPDDFESLSAAYIALASDVTTTFNYDLNSDYGQPGGTENYNTHSESLTGQSLSVSANKMYLLDISGVLSSLAASDFLGVRISKNSGSNNQYAIGLLLLINLT